MTTHVKIWEIKEKSLNPIRKTLKEGGRQEAKDLEEWIRSYPKLLGENILLIGEQVTTKLNKRLDYLGIDKNGNIVIIELKRDKIPRRTLAQAMDYASDIASWSINELDERCRKFTNQNIEDYIVKNFPIEDLDWDEISINQSQRILLVGTSISESLERMINWLSDNYGVLINALIISYGITSNNDEILATSYIISEELEDEYAKKKKKQIIPKTIEEHRNWIKKSKIKSKFKDIENRIKTLSEDIREEAKVRYIAFIYKGVRIARLFARENFFHFEVFYQEPNKSSKSSEKITINTTKEDLEPLFEKLKGYIQHIDSE
ncbi:MAG: hypothetical protein GF311_23320 [Candidatus Lokiarchaeota archaeon]|nr:hypothetical protein [Candidatus Lokiarchaeota archaeon]